MDLETFYYPVYLDLRGRTCLVVGGGDVAAGKVRGLLQAGAHVTVVAPEAHDDIARLCAQGRLVWLRRAFQPADLAHAFLVVASSDEPALNALVYRLADAQSRLANAVDDPDHCNFIAPAVASAGPLQVAVSTSGASPALARQLRDEIARLVLTPERARLASFLGDWRGEVKRALPTYRQRKAFWEGVLRSDIPELLIDGDSAGADERMRELIAQAAPSREPAPSRGLSTQAEIHPGTPREGNRRKVEGH